MAFTSSRLTSLRPLLFEPRLLRWGSLAATLTALALLLTSGLAAAAWGIAGWFGVGGAVWLARLALERRHSGRAPVEDEPEAAPELEPGSEGPYLALAPARFGQARETRPEVSSWTPIEDVPLPERLAHLTRAGGALGLLGDQLVHELEGASRYGHASFDVAMAVHYAYNAAVVTWQHHLPGNLPSELVRSLKDAAALSHWERDDDDGYGQATFHALIGALAPLLTAGDPEPDPLERYRGVGGEGIGQTYDLRLWHPNVLQERFGTLSAADRALVLERQRTFLAYLADIYPARMEHQLLLATLLALDGRFGEAAVLCRDAMAGGAYLLDHFRRQPAELGKTVLGYAARSLRLLLDRARADESAGPYLVELATHLVAVQEARVGPGGTEHAEAVELLEVVRGLSGLGSRGA